MFLPSDDVIETTTYGGVVNTACHGTGKTQVRLASSLQSGACFVRCRRAVVGAVVSANLIALF